MSDSPDIDTRDDSIMLQGLPGAQSVAVTVVDSCRLPASTPWQRERLHQGHGGCGRWAPADPPQEWTAAAVAVLPATIRTTLTERQAVSLQSVIDSANIQCLDVSAGDAVHACMQVAQRRAWWWGGGVHARTYLLVHMPN